MTPAFLILSSLILSTLAHYISPSIEYSNVSCVADWAKCGGQNWTGPVTCCNARYECNKTDEYYSECIPAPLIPFPPAPASIWCGEKGMTLNKSMLSIQGAVSSLEIGYIWMYATANLTMGRAPGGKETCMEAISTALGECGHPETSAWMNTTDPVCSFSASGAGGIWQVTSQDSSDTTLAGCSSGEDPCCNARLAYAHAFNQGGASVIPADYCSHQNDCKQITTECGQDEGPSINWNSPTIDQKKPNAVIPFCSHTTNPWYPPNSTYTKEWVSVDQEPCYWGPFSIAAGGNGKEFFPGFYGWGGFFQHYLGSKAGRCDPSPQCVAHCDWNGTYAKYPSYIELAIEACAQIKDQ